jgi:hypothetical protein
MVGLSSTPLNLDGMIARVDSPEIEFPVHIYEAVYAYPAFVGGQRFAAR